jgi:hypothetical protein
MDRRNQPQPIRNGEQASLNAPDENAVLRLSRASLRARPPVVRFIERQPTFDVRRGMRWPA